MDVTPVIVTRGDVDLVEILDSLRCFSVPPVVWNNAVETDEKVWGRYVAVMERVNTEWVYVQDDDCIVEHPMEIYEARERGKILCNMPEAHREKYAYSDDSLVGFGAVFESRLVPVTFDRYFDGMRDLGQTNAHHLREADRIFTVLNHCKWVDVPKRDLPWATNKNRMYHEHGHVESRLWAIMQCAEIVANERALCRQ